MGGFLDLISKLGLGGRAKADPGTVASKLQLPVSSAGAGSAIYPSDLFTPGNEPYIIFEIRDAVNKGLLKNSLALYMPPTIQVNYGAGYSPVQLSILQWLDIGSDVINGVQNLQAQGIHDWRNMGRKDLEGVLRSPYAQYAAQAVDYLGSDMNLGQQASNLTKQTINPHMAMVFEGVQFRTFSFTFQMMARNEEETKSINQIIKMFKLGMHPQAKGVEGLEHFWTWPDVFDIKLFSPTQEFLYAISTSVLTDMNVDYAGSGIPSFFKGNGAPVDVRMNLTFTEQELLTKERIEKGF